MSERSKLNTWLNASRGSDRHREEDRISKEKARQEKEELERAYREERRRQEERKLDDQLWWNKTRQTRHRHL